MAQIRTKDTVDAVKELVSQLTPLFIIKEATDNGNGTFTLSTNRTYWLTINKRITIDSIEYRITAFDINVSITIKPITTGDPIPTVTFFTIPAPLFFHGVTLMAIDEQGKPKDPNQRTPFIWLYEILDETVIRDEFDPWGRNSKPQLFFMDESSLADWTSAQHKTNVLEPMRQMVELFFEKINDFQGDKYKEVLTSSQIGRANWGKFITDLGSVKKFFNEDLSGHQVGFDFTMSKTECDTRSANPVTCNLTAQVTTIPETGVGTNDGIAIATPVGGIGPYTYSWSGPSAYSSSLQCIVDLVPGVYTVVITDTGVESCSDQESGTVAAAGGACALSITSTTNTPPSAFGASDGTATVDYSGEVGSVSILWEPSGQTTAMATGLTAGNHCVVVSDLGTDGCFKIGSTTLVDPAPTSLAPDDLDNITFWMDIGVNSSLNGGSVADGNPISTTDPISPAFEGLDQATGGRQPIYENSGMASNSLPYADFIAISDQNLVNTNFISSASWTAIIVFEATTALTNGNIFDNLISGGSGARLYITQTNVTDIRFNLSMGDTGIQTVAFNIGQTYIITATGNASTMEITLKVNDLTVQSSTSTVWKNTNQLTLGAKASGVTSENLDGKIGEFIWYRQLHTEANLDAVVVGLDTKFGGIL